jgi:parallel beta-helix repeat protein
MSLSMSPTSALVGATVTLTGRDFGRKLRGTVKFGGIAVQSFVTNPQGTFNTTFVVPGGNFPGLTTVEVSTTARTETTQFAVLVPEPPPDPDPEPTGDCSGVTVPAGSTATEVQALIAANPGATTFCWEEGEYVIDRFIIPKTGNTHESIVPRGAVLTGLGVYAGGFKGYGGSTGQQNVSIIGFIIEKMAHTNTSGLRAGISCGWNWTVDNNEVRECSQLGVDINTGGILTDNYLHHNGRYGFAGGPCTTFTADGNEISYNNTGNYAIGDCGGFKIIRSGTEVALTALEFPITITNNNVHHNYGNGMWTDWCNAGVLYEGNIVEDNLGIGIFHEASVACVIRSNTVRRNALNTVGKSLFYGAEIFLNDSKNTEIHNNTIVATLHGIGLRDGDRGSDVYGLLEVRDVNVHDNDITMSVQAGRNGLVGSSRTACYVTGVNRFEGNIYRVPSTSMARWNWNTERDWNNWRSLGHDDVSPGALTTV